MPYSSRFQKHYAGNICKKRRRYTTGVERLSRTRKIKIYMKQSILEKKSHSNPFFASFTKDVRLKHVYPDTMMTSAYIRMTKQSTFHRHIPYYLIKYDTSPEVIPRDANVARRAVHRGTCTLLWEFQGTKGEGKRQREGGSQQCMSAVHSITRKLRDSDSNRHSQP